MVFAIGAILSFAITVSESHGVNWNMVGNILMGVGAFGVLLSLLMWGVGPWGGYRTWGGRRRSTVVDTPGGVVRREDVDVPL